MNDINHIIGNLFELATRMESRRRIEWHIGVLRRAPKGALWHIASLKVLKKLHNVHTCLWQLQASIMKFGASVRIGPDLL